MCCCCNCCFVKCYCCGCLCLSVIAYFILGIFGFYGYTQLCRECIGENYLKCMESIAEKEGDWNKEIYYYEGERLLELGNRVVHVENQEGYTGPMVIGNSCNCMSLDFSTCKRTGTEYDCDFSNCSYRCKLKEYVEDSRTYHYSCSAPFKGVEFEEWAIFDGKQCANPLENFMLPGFTCEKGKENCLWFKPEWSNCETTEGWKSYYKNVFKCDKWEHKEVSECYYCQVSEWVATATDMTKKAIQIAQDIAGIPGVMELTQSMMPCLETLGCKKGELEVRNKMCLKHPEPFGIWSYWNKECV